MREQLTWLSFLDGVVTVETNTKKWTRQSPEGEASAASAADLIIQALKLDPAVRDLLMQSLLAIAAEDRDWPHGWVIPRVPANIIIGECAARTSKAA